MYKYDKLSGTWTVFQAIATLGAVDFEYLAINGVHFLAVANHNDDVGTNVKSVIYQFDPISNRFVSHQVIPY